MTALALGPPWRQERLVFDAGPRREADATATLPRPEGDRTATLPRPDARGPATLPRPEGDGPSQELELGGEPSLDAVLSGLWEGLAAHQAVPCAVCGGEMQPVYGAHSRPLGGRCRTCESELR